MYIILCSEFAYLLCGIYFEGGGCNKCVLCVDSERFCLRVSLRGEREGGGRGELLIRGVIPVPPLEGEGGRREAYVKDRFCFFTLFAVLVLIKRDIPSSRPRVVYMHQ